MFLPAGEFFFAKRQTISQRAVCERKLFINMYQKEAYDFQMDSFLISTALINLNIKEFACLYTLKIEHSKRRQNQL